MVNIQRGLAKRMANIQRGALWTRHWRLTTWDVVNVQRELRLGLRWMLTMRVPRH